MAVARKEVLVQLDDLLVTRLDEVAGRLGTSRSELLRRGALAVLEAEALEAADQQLRDAYHREPQDPAIVESALRLARGSTPQW
jgi:metal-responsive CopG/Arc/MetJ family transcriptional regulator